MLKKIALLVAGVTLLGSAAAQDQSGVKVETVIKTESSWDGTPYRSYPTGRPEITVLKISIPAHTVLPWHTHPMPNAGYVESGEITVEKKNGEKKVVTQGQVLPETVNSIHRGYTGDSPVVLIVFYAGEHGTPLSQKE
jgi:quercetin dioxygenase-like cupin family protein